MQSQNQSTAKTETTQAVTQIDSNYSTCIFRHATQQSSYFAVLGCTQCWQKCHVEPLQFNLFSSKPAEKVYNNKIVFVPVHLHSFVNKNSPQSTFDKFSYARDLFFIKTLKVAQQNTV